MELQPVVERNLTGRNLKFVGKKFEGDIVTKGSVVNWGIVRDDGGVLHILIC